MTTSPRTRRSLRARLNAVLEGSGDLLHDLAADHCQQLDNVRHMTWFRHAVARELWPELPESEVQQL
jgi:hypothetical protein